MEIHTEIINTLGEYASAKRMVCKWAGLFINGTSFEDGSRYGYSKGAGNSKNP